MNPSFDYLQQHLGIGAVIIGLIVVWSLIWKGIALWKSARNGQKIWFVILLIVNTVGILEIIYLLCCGRKKEISAPQQQ